MSLGVLSRNFVECFSILSLGDLTLPQYLNILSTLLFEIVQNTTESKLNKLTIRIYKNTKTARK